MMGSPLLEYRLGLLAICLLAFALRLHLLEDIFFTEDEEKSQLLYVQQPVTQILLHYESNNHWLMNGLGHVWGQLGQQRFLLRWPAVFFGTLAVPLVSLAGYWLFGSRKIGWLTAFLLALSAFHLYWSQQFRGYSPLLFFSLLSLLLLYRALQTGRQGYWWGFSGSMALALASHLYGILALSVAAVILMRWLWSHGGLGSPQQRWAWPIVVVALALSGCFLWFGKRYVIDVYHPSPEATLPELIYYQWLAFGPTLPEIGDFFKGLALAFTAHPHEGMALALFGGLGLIGWFLCSTQFPRAAQFLVLWLVMPVVAVIVAELALAGFFAMNRFLIFILPAWLLLVGGGLTIGFNRLAGWLAPAGWPRSALFLGLILISLSYWSWLNLKAAHAYFDDQASNDWRGVAAYLANRLKPTDVVICSRLLHPSPPRPDENDKCMLELKRRLATVTAPNQVPQIVAANNISLHLKAYGSVPGTVWVVIWGVNALLYSPAAITFDRLGYTTLLKIDTGPTLAANLAQAVAHLTHLDLPLPPPNSPPQRSFWRPAAHSPDWLHAAGLASRRSDCAHHHFLAGPGPYFYGLQHLFASPRPGQTVTQLDFRPFEGEYPISHWLPGSIIAETRLWLLPADLPPGPYTLHSGLYQAQTLARLPLRGDNVGENAMSLGQVWLE